ncbi:MAG: hypothetical protein CSA21_06385 [Deltaproteobacteria bacterium]|nr:MAG: hypothetical protein CSA21_06385 [Deltaproteobacteria bacterium]
MLTLAKGFTINGSFGYNKIAYDKFSDTNGDYKDNRATYAPEYTYNLGFQYRHASGFYVRGDLIGQDRMYFDQANKFGHDPYALVNARIGYEMDSLSLDIYVYGKNILGTEYDYKVDYGGMYTFYNEPLSHRFSHCKKHIQTDGQVKQPARLSKIPPAPAPCHPRSNLQQIFSVLPWCYTCGILEGCGKISMKSVPNRIGNCLYFPAIICQHFLRKVDAKISDMIRYGHAIHLSEQGR